ncbi:MAG: DUF1345 domain-containing protein [Sphingomicrobium sp.]
MARQMHIGNRIAPPRFLLFIILLAIGWPAGIIMLGLERGLLAGFDLAALGFLLSYAPALKLQAQALRDKAARNDANRWFLLVITILLSLVILAAISAQIGSAESLDLNHKLLIVATLVLVWIFGNTVYALHYAHLYYTRDTAGRDCEGLKFPGEGQPGMADFVYFAFTLGVAVQTADVAITSAHIRRVATIHCVIGFFFNLGVLALAVNVLGSH